MINTSPLLNQHKSTISTIPDINSCLSYTLTHGTQANKLTTKLKMHQKYLYLSSKQADMNKLEQVKRLSLQSLSKSDNEYAQRISSVISRQEAKNVLFNWSPSPNLQNGKSIKIQEIVRAVFKVKTKEFVQFEQKNKTLVN